MAFAKPDLLNRELEAEMLRSATGLLEDGRISIIVKKRDGITTYLAERVA